MEVLGVGSRVNHPDHGAGVVVFVHKRAYDICFINKGIKGVLKDYDMEVIEALENEYSVSFSEAEDALIKILREWSDVTEIIHIADRYDGGTMILEPADKNYNPKKFR